MVVATLPLPPSLAPRGRRGWKKFYAVLKGTILYLQKVRDCPQSPYPKKVSAVFQPAPALWCSEGPWQDVGLRQMLGLPLIKT